MNKSVKSAFQSQQGSAFFYILLGVVLFGALAFTVSRGMRSQSTTTISAREADLMASDILDYAQKIEKGVNRVMQKSGMTEDQLSFENDLSTEVSYENTNCADEACLVFHSLGGAVTWQDPPEKATDYTWHFTDNQLITGYDGAGHAGVVLQLFGVDRILCETLNKHLDLNYADVPVHSGSLDATAFTGSYKAGEEITCDGGCEGAIAACIRLEGDYNAGGDNLGDGYLFYYGVYNLPGDF